YQKNSGQKGECYEDRCHHRAIFARVDFHRLWFERFSAFYSAAAAGIRAGSTVFHGPVYIALPGICFWAATARGCVVSLSTNRSVGVDRRWADNRQHSAFPCADGSGRNCARSGGDGSLVRSLLAVPRGFLRNSLWRNTIRSHWMTLIQWN